jgi:hypothetical protein
MQDPKWQNVRGGIRREGPMTIISLGIDGWGQRIVISTRRLRMHPELWKRTLNQMVRDIQERVA